jgi:phosphatidylglycerol---prolipoprotein diacylglyceryl transferase
VIPFVQQPSITLGPIRLQAFGAILMIAVLVGEAMYRRRMRQQGLDAEAGMGMAWYILVAGFVGAHLFSVLAYFPDKVARNPLLLFKVWEDVSSFGGMLGGAAGAAFYLRTKGAALTRRTKWAYLDAVAFVSPFGWAVGRIACSLAHDHPGTITSFPLAISLSSARARDYIAGVYAGAGLPLPQADQFARLGFHDLGWYEFLYLTFVVVPLFLWLDHTCPAWLKRPGGWVATFALVYAPMRLALDTLRVADVRYFGFTPGQYAAALLLVGALILFIRPPRPIEPVAVA